MCKWGNSTPLRVFIPANLSRTGEARWDTKDVDSCIAPIVAALNAAEVVTVASCCGHGKQPGNIALADGREIIIAPDYETGRRIDAMFPPIHASDDDGICSRCNGEGYTPFGEQCPACIGTGGEGASACQ